MFTVTMKATKKGDSNCQTIFRSGQEGGWLFAVAEPRTELPSDYFGNGGAVAIRPWQFGILGS